VNQFFDDPTSSIDSELCLPELLWDYLDGALDESILTGVGEHVTRCGRCADQLLQFEQVRSRLAEWDLPNPFPRFAERVIARLDSPAAAPVPTRPKPFGERAAEWLLEQLVPAALAGSAAAALFFLFMQAPVPDPVTLDGLLGRSVDQEVRPLVTSQEDDLSHDDIFALLLVTER
jgi:anti-sigma factor RsiW